MQITFSNQDKKRVFLQFLLYFVGAILLGLIIARVMHISNPATDIKAQLLSPGPQLTAGQAQESLEDIKSPASLNQRAPDREVLKALQQ